MKKTLSIFVLLLMVLSVMPLALAQEEDIAVDAVDGVVEEAADDIVDSAEETIVEEDEAEVEDEAESELEVEAESDVEAEIEEDEEAEAEDEDVEGGVRITPDSPFWGLKRAIERIDLALTFGKSAKAEKGLAHARERLLEVQQMIQEKKMEQAAKAQEAHERIMARVENNVAGIGNGDDIEALESIVEIEGAMNAHKNLVQRVNDAMLKTKGLSDEQNARAAGIIESFGERAEGLKVQIDAKQEKARIKIKAKAGISDEDVESLVAQIRAGEPVEARIQAAKMIAEQASAGRAKVLSGQDVEEVESEAEEDPEEEEAPAIDAATRGVAGRVVSAE